MTADDEVEQLRGRLERERKARRQAEVIAERGMRELWDANRELQTGVRRRTASLEHLVGGIDLAHRALEHGAARAAVVVPPVAPASSCSPQDIGDRLVERWQLAAAAVGLLLVVDVEAPDELHAPWSHVIATCEIMLRAFVAGGGPGTLSVSILASPASLSTSIGGPSLGGGEDRTLLEAAAAVVAEVGGELDVRTGEGGTAEVAAAIELV